MHYGKPIPQVTPYQEPTMETIADIAHSLADKYNDSYDSALTAVTTHAAQLDYDVPEGGQAPDVEIEPEDADHIVRAYEAYKDEDDNE